MMETARGNRLRTWWSVGGAAIGLLALGWVLWRIDHDRLLSVVIEGEFGAGKPDRRVFEALLSALDSAPEDAWTIGDNLEFDVLAPMQLGLHGIWVDRRNAGLDGRPGRPHRIVSAFTEIVEPPARPVSG